MSYLHHHPLWCQPTRRPTFDNGDFIDVDNPIEIAPGIIEITGWTFYLKQTKANALDTIAGWPTPADTSLPLVNNQTDDVIIQSGFSFAYEFTDTVLPPGYVAPKKAVRLYTNENSINESYGILRGPYMVSNRAIYIQSGDNVRFWYKGQGAIDAYDIFGYLQEVDTGATIQLVNQSGENSSGTTPWTQVDITISTTGKYKFVFINGCWDFTGGRLLGSSMYVTGVQVVSN
jgi:hypothetical protein